jgi:hypothetical protein
LRFAEVTPQVLDALERRVEDELGGQPTLEAAAQRFADILFETFEDSLILARVFVTVPYAKLPPFNQQFLRRMVGPRASEVLADRLPVLSLVGTRGRRPAWNDRRRSEGHVGIPLASAEFVDGIPMIASLMKQLGAAIRESDGVETGIVVQSLGSAAGLFYVDDARRAVDSRGRPIIAAQSFVEENGVRTVFGFGGAYATVRNFMAAVLFTSEDVPRAQAERFMRLANTFKAVTLRAASRGNVFGAA